MYGNVMDVDILAERILLDLKNTFKKDPLIDEFDVLPVHESNCNTCPVIHIEHKVALEDWCVKHVYVYAYSRFFTWRKKPYKVDPDCLLIWTSAILLINPETETVWNARKELVCQNLLLPENELKFSEIALSRKPKSSPVYAHRKWVLLELRKGSCNPCSLQQTVEHEMSLCTRFATLYPSNYHAWCHRSWVLKELCGMCSKSSGNVLLTDGGLRKLCLSLVTPFCKKLPCFRRDVSEGDRDENTCIIIPVKMKKHPLSASSHIRSYESTRARVRPFPDLSDYGRANSAMLKRRHSSEGALIHITGTGTTSEEAVGNKDRLEQLQERSQEFDDLFSAPGALCVGQYGDFHTIDWQRDMARDRYRHRYIKRKMPESVRDRMHGYCDKLAGWMCVCLVGVTAGSVAGFIDIGEGWMNDLKQGVCPEAFWLNKEQCCWSSNDTFYEGDECEQWFSWYRLFRLRYFSTEEYLLSYAFYVFWSLLFGALAASMVKTFAPYACGSGLPEIKTILGGFIMRGYLGKWTLVVKSLGTMLAVSAGMSLGKEGPMVHVVCCLGNIASYLFPKYGKNEAKKREILSAAAAAGVSIAFGAPIGGVLFSLEEVSYYFPMRTLWRSFVCALVAAFVLRSIDPFGTDHVVKFYMNTTRAWILVELLPFILLGVIGGVIGTAFIRCNIAWCRYRKSSKLGQFPILEVSAVAFLTSLISFPNEFTRMDASDLIKLLFSQCGRHDISPLCDYKRNVSSVEYGILEAGPGINQSIYLLLCALICKFIITIFTFGIKIPCGVFIPSLAMGAIMGRIIGVGMQQLALYFREYWPFHAACALNENCMAPGLYAMIGAASCLAGVTRMTVSLVVIMFELTGRVDYIMPLMATVVASKWVGDAIDKDSIYDAHIQLNDYPYLDNKKTFRYSTRAIDLIKGKVSKTGIYCLTERGMTLAEIENVLNQTSHNGFPITVSLSKPCLVGFVLRRDLCLTLEHMKINNPQITKKTMIDFVDQSQLNTRENSIQLNRIVDQENSRHYYKKRYFETHTRGQPKK